MVWCAAFVKNQNSLHIMMPFEAIPDDGNEVTLIELGIVENQVGENECML